MLRDEMALYEKLTGKDPNKISISCLGSFLDGYERGLEVPSAERKKGKWINGKCSNCGEHAPFWAMASTYHESNFCPNCGADMRGTEWLITRN